MRRLLCPLARLCLMVLSVGSAHAASFPFTDGAGKLDTKTWYVANGWANGEHQSCEWRAEAITFTETVARLRLSDQGGKVRPLGCAEMHTTTLHGYGTYRARLKTAAGSGLNTAFFTYVGPAVHGGEHSEIDFEFLGKNPRTVQLNFFDKGVSQGEKLIDLGFDASADFHDYSFVWAPDRIRWYVDGKLVHETAAGAHIPGNPGRIYLSLWSGSDKIRDWLGPFTYDTPRVAEFTAIGFEPLP